MRAQFGRIGRSMLVAGLLAGCQTETVVEPGMATAPTAAGPANAGVYTMTLLGPELGCKVGTGSARDVNASGMIVGSSDCLTGRPGRAVYWTAPSTVATSFAGATDYSAAWGVNARGAAVGHVDGQAAYWPTPATLIQFATPGFGGMALDINDRGDIVGRADLMGYFENHAFLIKAGTKNMIDLGTLPGGDLSEAQAISPTGVIVGFSEYTRNGDWHAVWWDASLNIHDLGVLPGAAGSYGYSINSSGTMVGGSNFYSSPPRGGYGFKTLPKSQALVNLGTGYGISGGGSWALDINDQGTIVGRASFKTGIIPAYLPPGNISWVPLATPVGYVGDAEAIDARCRYIVGEAYDPSNPNVYNPVPVLWSLPSAGC